MSEPLVVGLAINETTVASLATALEAFADTLSDRERALLQRWLTRALDPWERMRLRDPSEVLLSDEVELLQKLEGEEER